MSQENVEIVREIYAKWRRGDMKAGVERFDPKIVFESFMPDASERVVMNGADKIEAFMREFLRQWRDYRILGDEFREVGPTRVFVSGRQAAVGHDSGAAVEGPLFSVWNFRDGKVVHLVFERDRHRALEAAGLSQ
jgi:ketosteroid isomerase-like protein